MPPDAAHGTSLAARIATFKADLPLLGAGEIVRRHILHGGCSVIDDPHYHRLKEEVAGHFGIHPNEVLAVGSAKLGFSIKQTRRYQPFGDTSDLDLVLISPTLFDQIWDEVFRYHQEVGYWPAERDFCHYLFRGWIRPDKLPPAAQFELAKDWWDFFRKLTSSGAFGPYKISAGLYRSWKFLEAYQCVCVRECQEIL